MSLQQGTRLGPYEILSMLGKGGMGEVYRARDTRLDRVVAIKVLPQELAADEVYRRRLEREAKTIAQLQHPHICALYDVGSEPEAPFFLVMEHLRGATLEERIAQGPMPLPETLRVAREVAEAMEAAHRRAVVHRDLKPGNVMLTEHGTKVLDFGLAKEFRGPHPDVDTAEETRGAPVTAEGTIAGTLPYMAPEQLEGKAADARTDLWALGCIVYEMLSGVRPFEGSTQAALITSIMQAAPVPVTSRRSQVPARVEAILRRCFDRDPELRWQSARDLGLELAAIAEPDAAPVATGSPVTVPAPDSSLADARTEVVRAPVRTATAPPTDLEKTDVFIACTAVDDQPLAMQDRGWISEFQRQLEVRIAQLSGEEVKVSLALVSDKLSPEDPLLPALHRAKAMVAVVTPSFVKSESCRRVVEEFWQEAERSGGVWLGSQARLFKVVKTPTPVHDVPPGLGALFSQLRAFDFFEEQPDTGRVIELDEHLGSEIGRHYYERVYDVAQEVQRTLSAVKQEASGALAAGGVDGDRRVVYLASASSDVGPDCDRLRRELAARGHEVLPDRPLPLVAEELEATVRELLERCDLALHPIGATYGLIPEDAEQSIVEIQNRLAAERSEQSGLQRFIWLARDTSAAGDRHRAFVRSLKQDPRLHQGAEIVHCTLENLKALVLEHLAPEPGPVPARTPKAAPRVYLICDKKDEEAIEPLEDFLYEQGFEVSLPDFEADEAEAAEVHRQNLLDCDGVLVFYGAARSAWVDIKLRSLLKARGYGREGDLAAQAVYVMPPFDRRKERFRSQSADVLRPQEPGFEPEVLQGFVERLKAGSG